jgi:hypothetical protein
MKTKSYLFLIPVVALSCVHRTIPQASLPPVVRERIKNEILDMQAKDQAYRWQIMFGELDNQKIDSILKLSPEEQVKNIKLGKSNYPLSPKQRDSLLDVQGKLDSINDDRILAIYKEYGWPGKNLVGTRAAGVVDIITLHFPDSIQLRLIHSLRKEYKRGNIEGASIARLYDKYQMDNNSDLLYGMFTKDTLGKSLPVIKDITRTNKARKALGLPPLTEYFPKTD